MTDPADRELLIAELHQLRDRLARLARADHVSPNESREPRLRSLLENSPDVISVMDLDMHVLYLSRTVSPFTQEGSLGMCALDFMPAPDRETFAAAFKQVLATQAPQQTEVSTRGGHAWQTRLVPLRDGDETFAVMGIGTDITDRRRLEEQLRQAQKMDALGQLTAGIAHNFNNMLTVILSNLQLAIPLAQGDAKARLMDADHAGRRAADMVRELMVFSRKHPSHARMRMHLAEVAKRTLDICRTTFDKTIELSLHVGKNVPQVSIDSGQIEQVLLNICLNARDALDTPDAYGEKPRSAFALAHRRIELRISAVPDGAQIEIEDNGPGMTEEVRQRIFEPFFTTKDVGRGTGLGLATAYGIVTDHGGSIECDSQPGEGARFRVRLPAASGDEDDAGHRDDCHDWAGGSGDRPTLLLVEDDDMVRRTTAVVLQTGGYDVLQAASGEQALELYAREAARIRLVVLDWSMPRMSGEHVVAELARIAPGTGVLLFSGNYPLAAWPANVRGVVHKPAPMETLLSAVRSALEAG